MDSSAKLMVLEAERRRCADKELGPFYFMENHFWTKDEADVEMPEKRYPGPGEKAYCYVMIDRWLRYNRLIIPKSRRLIGTWTFIGLFAHDAAFNRLRNNYIQAEKDDKTGELIDRVEWSAVKMREKGFITGYKRRREPHEVEFPDTGSIVRGVPAGSEQLRQFAASNILIDEAAFQAELRASLKAATSTSLSCGEVRGRIVLLSTANSGSYMQDLVFGSGEIEKVSRAA